MVMMMMKMSIWKMTLKTSYNDYMRSKKVFVAREYFATTPLMSVIPKSQIIKILNPCFGTFAPSTPRTAADLTRNGSERFLLYHENLSLCKSFLNTTISAKSDFRSTVQCNGNGELNKFMIELDKNDEILTRSSPQ